MVLEGTYVYKAKFLNPMGQNSIWYHDPPATLPVMFKMKQVINSTLTFNGITDMNQLPLRFGSYKDTIP